MSPLGGSERRLLDFPVGGFSWSPDGRWLAAARARSKGETTPESGGIHLIPAGGGEPRAVTFPKPPAEDRFPAFSPDGRALAYATCAAQSDTRRLRRLRPVPSTPTRGPRARRDACPGSSCGSTVWPGRATVARSSHGSGPTTATCGVCGPTVALLPSEWSWRVATLTPPSPRAARIASGSRGVSGNPSSTASSSAAPPTAAHRVVIEGTLCAVLAGRPADRLRVRAIG